jgi:hypothetical protein
MDFTLRIYKQFLHSLLANDYSFQTLENFIQHPNKGKVAILRHDVDRLPGNSLKTALLENELGIRATYFFRTIPQTFKPQIIKEIAEMGHEVGYHYENLTTCGGDLRLAIDDFRLNLEKMRKFCPVKTICMHGSPLSKWDNRNLWKRYNYRDYGIIAEPYSDVDYSQVFYITDTGRMWNNASSSVRDRVDSGFNIAIQSTSHLIALAEQNALPYQIMINVHPQRWTDKPLPWVKELVWQNFKNVVKRLLLKLRN